MTVTLQGLRQTGRKAGRPGVDLGPAVAQDIGAEIQRRDRQHLGQRRPGQAAQVGAELLARQQERPGWNVRGSLHRRPIARIVRPDNLCAVRSPQRPCVDAAGLCLSLRGRVAVPRSVGSSRDDTGESTLEADLISTAMDWVDIAWRIIRLIMLILVVLDRLSKRRRRLPGLAAPSEPRGSGCEGRG